MKSALVSIMLIFAGILPAQAATVAKGQFDLYLNGQRKGYEKFKIQRNEKSGYEVYSSEMHFQMPMLKTKRNYIDMKLYPRLTLGLEKGEFLDYEYRLNFDDFSSSELVESESSATEYVDQNIRYIDPMAMTDSQMEDEMKNRVDLGVNAGGLERRGQTLVFKQTKFSSTRTKDEQFPADLRVLDAYAFVLYIPIAKRAMEMKTPTESFSVALPQGMRVRPGKVEYVGTASTPFRGKSPILKHFEVLLDETVMASFWVDAAGTLVQVSIPAEGVLAVLMKYEPQSFSAEETVSFGKETVITAGGFQERPFKISSGDTTLSGSFVAPSTPGPHPVAILAQELGPVDRDGNGTEEAIRRTSPVKQVAFFLAEQGFATVRWDARGVEESGGRRDGNSPDLLASDIVSMARWATQQPGVRKDAVVVLGSGLGAWIAAIAAPEVPAAAFVGISFPVKPMLRLWKEQASLVPDPAERQKAYGELDLLAAQLKGTEEWGTYLGRKIHLGEYRSVADLDPAALVRQLAMPCLFAYPERDQVVLAHHKEIAVGLLQPHQSAIILPAGNHSMQAVDAEGNPKGLFDPKVAEPVVAWLKKVFPAGPPA